MPPEPLPLDRKDFFKEKKLQQERPDALASSTARLRDTRIGPTDEPRRPPGLCKQGSYQIFPEESGYGCTTSRSCERAAEVDSCRLSASRGEGRYGRSSSRVENKASFGSHRDWRGHRQRLSWEGGYDISAFSSSVGRQHDGMNALRSVDDAVNPHSDIENSHWDDLEYKDQTDKSGGVDGLGTGQMYDKDHSLGSIAWKTLKWTRSSSLSSRSSGFSHSSGSKSVKADMDDTRLELLVGKETPIRSPSGDAAEGVTSMASVEGTCPRKKPRLGWGQGLAKYEKEKVEGPEDTAGKNGLVLSTCNVKNAHCTSSPILPDASPKVASLSECMSPATPCSVACSSSSGLEDKHVKVSNNDIDASQFSNSPGQGSQKWPEELSANMEHLELNPINNINSLLVDLLASQDASTGDSDFVQSTALNKLLLLKTDILKLLERTECDIDLFESELKSLDFKSEANSPFPTASESGQIVAVMKPCKEAADAAPNLSVREPLPCDDLLKVQAGVKDEDIDSPGTVTSELHSIEGGVSAPGLIKLDHCAADFEATKSVAPVCVSFHSMERSLDLCKDEDSTRANESAAVVDVQPAVNTYGEEDSTLCALIFAKNKELARKTSEVFGKCLPTVPPEDIWGTDDSASCRKSDLHVREKLFKRLHFRRFKEHVLTLKFRAFHHLWKEDMRLLSLKKNRAKSQKRFELSFRYSHNGYQKHRSSIRSRFTSPGNSTLVPTAEITDFTSNKLLSDSHIKLYRSSLKMPALTLDERRHSRFITYNGLVEDPCAVEKERELINPWAPEEKEIFMEKLATYGKDFTKIASFLSHKTTADCIEFYYKNHKSESFEKIKKRLVLRKQMKCFTTNTYLVTSGKKWNRDVNAASLDMLGAASAVASHADDRETRHMYTSLPILGHFNDRKPSLVNDGMLERTSSIDIPGNESEAAAADALASICGGLSSEAVSSCITNSVDPADGCQEWKGQRARSMIQERPFTSEVSQNIEEDETCSDDSCGELDSADWTDEEKSTFIMALRTYGKDFASISRFVRTRSREQCKIFFSKARKCLGLDLIHREPDNDGTRMSDASGGRSDTEDACVVEMESAICSTQSCSKIDVDLPLSLPTRHGRSEGAGNNILQDGSSEKNEIDASNLEEVGTGMKESDSCLDQSGIKGSVFDGDNSFSKGMEGQSAIIPKVSPKDEAHPVDALMGCRDMPVQFLYGADLSIDADTKGQGTGQTSSHDQLNSVSPEGPLRLCPSASDVEDEHLKEELNQCIHVDVEVGEEGFNQLLKNKSISEQLLVPEAAPLTSLDDMGIPMRGNDANSCRTSSPDLPASNANRSSSHPKAEVKACPSNALVPDHQHQVPLELLCSAPKSQVISWQQENFATGLSNSSADDHHERFSQTTQSMLNFEEHRKKQHEGSENTDLYQPCLPLQVLRGYPLRLLNEETNKQSDLVSEKPVQKTTRINRDCRSGQSVVLEKCDGSESPVSVSEHSFLPRNCEQSVDLLRSGSRGLEKQVVGGCFETEEQSLRTGDVKLFGKILTHLSPLQKVNSPQEKNDNAVSPKSSKSISFKFSEHGTQGSLIGSKLETNGYLSLQEFPVTSFGVWDGNNRVSNGLPLLSSSAMLSATNGYPVASCQIEPQPLSAVIRRNDRVLGRVLGYLNKDASANGGLTSHQVYQSYDGTNVKPYSLDVKRHDPNGLETLLGFQQQGSAVVGMNGVGGGILVGTCSGISDPVVALKKHYANEARSGSGSASSAIREDESWSGDVGR